MNRLYAVVLGAALCAAGLQGQDRKRVAVMDFDYGTVRGSIQEIFGANQDVGKGITDLLVDKLVAGGQYSVIERKALDKILAEQNFGNSDRADSSTAAKIGQVLGVDVIIVGSITQFGRDDKKVGVGGGGFGGVTGRFGLGGVSRSNAKAVVGITARMINTTTAEILASASSLGESKRSGTSLGGAGGSGWSGGGGGLNMGSSNFANTIIGEAVNASVNDLAAKLNASAGALPVTVVQIDGLVADASPDGTLVLNVGSKSGVKQGAQLQVKRKVREVKDPATGKVLRLIEEPVGSLVITEVDEQSAVGKFTGAKPAQVGDRVTSR
jgi:curli biogenesis system outer membrane secretion channel CsgG